MDLLWSRVGSVVQIICPKTSFIWICQPDPRITEVRSRKVHQLEQEFDDEEISQGQIRKYFPETWIFAEGVVGWATLYEVCCTKISPNGNIDGDMLIPE